MTMRRKADQPAKSGAARQAGDREARLKAALKANLARRKAQARKRAGPATDNDGAEPQQD
ncbi:hypothetical protein roselon_03545 [Roseibacterium elongatum DSM 19469]|uniref:Uncharacterized protein n=1 Tax=Roseicyclus elongatus DSM 19469 TaxID=1294273 RepID=W8RX55_9RHOB|nr:hypothetical protein [Roseibacterium elongatum]AHM05799.1 hypothetical protein roselon_03545 [Roseibacterium elongatum DSM 19469]